MDRLGGGILVAHDLWATNEGICIDTEHRNLCGAPVDALRIAGSHLIALQIQDNHGEQDEHLLPDLGQIDWTGVSQALKDIDYRGVFMYELIRPEDLAAVYPNFRSIFIKYQNPEAPLPTILVNRGDDVEQGRNRPGFGA